MLKVVLDTSILVSALLKNSGVNAGVLQQTRNHLGNLEDIKDQDCLQSGIPGGLKTKYWVMNRRGERPEDLF